MSFYQVATRITQVYDLQLPERVVLEYYTY